MVLERVQKILAKAGIASRREAEKIILEGRVTVNGKVIQLGAKADPEKDHIKVDGKRIPRPEPKITLLLNKPRGYLSTVKDPKGRPTVMDLLGKVKWRLYPLGRLDFDAEGLLLLTNDGEIAYHLSHPKFLIPRTYWVKVQGVPGEKKLDLLKKGIRLEDGLAKAQSVQILREREKNSWIQITVTEGRNPSGEKAFCRYRTSSIKIETGGIWPDPIGESSGGPFSFSHTRRGGSSEKIKGGLKINGRLP